MHATAPGFIDWVVPSTSVARWAWQSFYGKAWELNGSRQMMTMIILLAVYLILLDRYVCIEVISGLLMCNHYAWSLWSRSGVLKQLLTMSTGRTNEYSSSCVDSARINVWISNQHQCRELQLEVTRIGISDGETNGAFGLVPISAGFQLEWLTYSTGAMWVTSLSPGIPSAFRDANFGSVVH